MRWIINNCCCASHLVSLRYYQGISNEKYHFKHCSHKRCSTKLISQVPTYFASSCLLMKLETSCSLFQPMKIAGENLRVWKKKVQVASNCTWARASFEASAFFCACASTASASWIAWETIRYMVGGEMEKSLSVDDMSLMHVNVFNYVPHMSHAVFMVVYHSSVRWDWTSACKDASGCHYQSILISTLHPTPE